MVAKEMDKMFYDKSPKRIVMLYFIRKHGHRSFYVVLNAIKVNHLKRWGTKLTGPKSVS